MKELLYVGNFNKWSDKNEDQLAEALEMFENVTICVSRVSKLPLKGQPTKIVDRSLKDRIKILYFKDLQKLLKEKIECKYIMFER